MEKESLYLLGIKAKSGDTRALLEIIERKRIMINKYSYNNEDLSQYIIEKLIIGIKNYNF